MTDNHNQGFIQQGWQCPICNSILAPTMNYCPFCSKGQSAIDFTTTGTPLAFYNNQQSYFAFEEMVQDIAKQA